MSYCNLKAQLYTLIIVTRPIKHNCANDINGLNRVQHKGSYRFHLPLKISNFGHEFFDTILHFLYLGYLNILVIQNGKYVEAL